MISENSRRLKVRRLDEFLAEAMLRIHRRESIRVLFRD
jgi:phosphoribosylpyrophosphate synthetase